MQHSLQFRSRLASLLALVVLGTPQAFAGSSALQETAREEVSADELICKPIAWGITVDDPAALQEQLVALIVRRRVLGSGAFANQEFMQEVLELRKQVASERPFEGQAQLIRDTCLLHARAAQAAGNKQVALAVLNQPTPEAEPSELGAGSRARSAGPVFAAMVIGVTQDQKVVALRHELQSAGQERMSSEQQYLDEAVAEAIKRREMGVLASIGQRALPQLLQVAFDPTLGKPGGNSWYLTALIKIDSPRAAREILALPEKESYLLRLMILDALNDNPSLTSHFMSRILQSVDRKGVLTLAAPEWLDVLAWVLEEPELANEALDLAKKAIEFNALSPRLAQTLAEIVQTGTDRQRAWILSQVSNDPRGAIQSDCLVPVLEAFLERGSGYERHKAAFQLGAGPRNEALMQSWQDEDPAIRFEVARSRLVLREKGERYIDRFGNEQSWPLATRARLEEGDREIVLGMLRDPAEEVRSMAVAAAISNSWLGRDDLVSLLERADAALDRQLLLSIAQLPPDAVAPLLDTLIARYVESTSDRQSDFIGGIELALVNIKERDMRTVEPFLTRFLEADAYLQHVVLIKSWDLDDGQRAALLVRSLAAIEERKIKEKRAHDFFGMLTAPVGMLVSEERLSTRTALARSEPDALASVMGMYLPAATPQMHIYKLFRRADSGLEQVYKKVAHSNDATIASRITALYYLDFRDASASEKIVQTIPIDQPLLLPEAIEFGLLVLSLTPEARASFQDRLLESPSANRELVVHALAGMLVPGDPGLGTRLGKALDWIIENHLAWHRSGTLVMGESSMMGWFERSTIDLLAQHPDQANPDRVAALFALKSSNSDEQLYLALSRLRDLALLPILEAQLESNPWVNTIRGGVRAARAITAYQSEAAGEVLARGLSSSIPDVRKECSAGLTEIERILNQKAQWAKRGSRLPTREETLAELLALLDESDVELRVEAVHALATLGAVEALPRMIHLIRDPEPKVAAAARAALARMRATGGRSNEDSLMTSEPGAEKDAQE